MENLSIENVMSTSFSEQVKEPYLSPEIEVIEVEVEKGFAASLDDRDNESW